MSYYGQGDPGLGHFFGQVFNVVKKVAPIVAAYYTGGASLAWTAAGSAVASEIASRSQEGVNYAPQASGGYYGGSASDYYDPGAADDYSYDAGGYYDGGADGGQYYDPYGSVEV